MDYRVNMEYFRDLVLEFIWQLKKFTTFFILLGNY